MSEVAIRGLESPVRRFSTHSGNSSKVNSSEKDLNEETLSIHSEEPEVFVNETAVTDNFCHFMLGFVNSKKREAEGLFDSRNKSAKLARASTEKVTTCATLVDQEYVKFLQSNKSRVAIISDGLKSGFDAHKMLSPIVLKLKEKSDFIREKVAENFKISSDDLTDRTQKIPELTKQLKFKEEELEVLSNTLRSGKFDEVSNDDIKIRLSEMEAKRESFELPTPPKWVYFFGNWAVKIYSFLQNLAWERHGVGKQYHEVAEELNRLNALRYEFVLLSGQNVRLKADIFNTRKELQKNEDGFELLKANNTKLEHLLNNVVNVYFTENIYKLFFEELVAAKSAKIVKNQTVKDSQVDLKKSSVSTTTNSSEVDLRSSMIFDSGVRSSRIAIDVYTTEFSNKIKAEGTSELEAVVAESLKMKKNAQEIAHAFSEVSRIFSSEYAKGVLTSEEYGLISRADFQARAYQVFLKSVYDFAEKVVEPATELFNNNKLMEQSTIEFTDSHAKLGVFDDIDKATLLISDNGLNEYSTLYRAMPPEFRKEYIKTRYSEELKSCPGLPVAKFTNIVSEALNLNEEESSEVVASLKSEDRRVEILYSSSFIGELESA